MSSYLILASALGLAMAIFGFYGSVRLDLPLGPTDVTLGCCIIFLAYGLRRVTAQASAVLVILVGLALSSSGCGNGMAAVPVPEAKAIHAEQLWLAKVKNSTALSLLLPSTNPLRSLAEMVGKISSDYRPSVMDLMRGGLKTELEQKGFRIALPEEKDERFAAFPTDIDGAVRIAREGNLSGLTFVSEVRRWEVEAQRFVRVLADFKIIRIEDGAVLWERRIQRAVPTPSATNVGQASTDAVREIVRDLFAG
jgi:hypothetical protein